MSQSELVRAAPHQGMSRPPNDPLPIHRFSKLRTRRALEGESSQGFCKIQLKKYRSEVVRVCSSVHFEFYIDYAREW